MKVPTWVGFLQWFFPIDIFKDIRDDIRELFEEAYYQHPMVSEAYAAKSVPQMQSTAKMRATEARNYKPGTPVKKIKSFLSGMASFIEVILLITFIIGIITGGSFLIVFGRTGLRALESLQSLLISVALGAPTLIGIIAGLVLIWLKIMESSPTIVQAFNQGLVIGPKDVVRINNKPELAGVIVWNSSLVGTGALKLINLFSVLFILSAIPGWDPYKFMMNILKSNMDVFVNVDGWRDASRELFYRIQS